jgi:hypothetical protein
VLEVHVFQTESVTGHAILKGDKADTYILLHVQSAPFGNVILGENSRFRRITPKFSKDSETAGFPWVKARDPS